MDPMVLFLTTPPEQAAKSLEPSGLDSSLLGGCQLQLTGIGASRACCLRPTHASMPGPCRSLREPVKRRRHLVISAQGAALVE